MGRNCTPSLPLSFRGEERELRTCSLVAAERGFNGEGTRIPLSYTPIALLIFQKLFETPAAFVTRR